MRARLIAVRYQPWDVRVFWRLFGVYFDGKVKPPGGGLGPTSGYWQRVVGVVRDDVTDGPLQCLSDGEHVVAERIF
jgi:hypothetical protein